MKQETLELNQFEIHDVEKIQTNHFLGALYDAFRVNLFLNDEKEHISALLITHKDFD